MAKTKAKRRAKREDRAPWVFGYERRKDAQGWYVHAPGTVMHGLRLAELDRYVASLRKPTATAAAARRN